MTVLFHRLFASRILFALTLLVVIYGLFFIPSDQQSTRLVGEIWNLGHVGAFWVIYGFAFSLLPQCQRFSATKLVVLTIVSALIAGAVIEWLQSFVGRDVELQDVLDSGVGALLAVAFFSNQITSLVLWQRMSLRVATLVVLLVVPWPIWSALTDEVVLRHQFPVLCDFSTPFELSRWHADKARIKLQKDNQAENRYLAVEFHPAIYSTISLKYFDPDWRGYRYIVFDLTNPERHNLHVILRMHDDLHKQHRFALTDRFNRELTLKPGRQQVTISIADVENAPATRKMDLQHMEDISLFTMQSHSYHQLYIHRIYLE